MAQAGLRFNRTKPLQVVLAEDDYLRGAENYYAQREQKRMLSLNNLNVKIYADGADLSKIQQCAHAPYISGFTTNPTLIRKSGITNYREFAKQALALLPKNKPISFEVLADEKTEMYQQAQEIHSWGEQVYVKVPVVNSQGMFNGDIIEQLALEGVKVNVTAIFTKSQIESVVGCLRASKVPSVLSVFAGRIADTGRDPVPIMRDAAFYLRENLILGQLLWASPRQVYDVLNAEVCGCSIITMTPDLISKLPVLGKPLGQYCVETVQMFRDDAVAAGLQI